MAPHSSTLAWKIPRTEEPGRLQSMGSLAVGHDWVTSLSLFTFMHWRRKWQPTPVFLPGESQGREASWAAICGVTQSRTRLKWLSSSSSGIMQVNLLNAIIGLVSPKWLNLCCFMYSLKGVLLLIYFLNNIIGISVSQSKINFKRNFEEDLEKRAVKMT